MTETNINAKLTALEQQRNHALNQVVNLSAELAEARELLAKAKDLADRAIARVAELEPKDENGN